MVRNRKNRMRAISSVPEAMPVKPNKAAIREITKKITAHLRSPVMVAFLPAGWSCAEQHFSQISKRSARPPSRQDAGPDVGQRRVGGPAAVAAQHLLGLLVPPVAVDRDDGA